MKTTININGQDVEITLTADQIAKIKKKPFHYTNINTLQDALEFRRETLEEFNHRTQFDDDSQRAYKELEVIAFAIRGGEPLGTEEEDKWYFPYFRSKRSSVGFSFDDCYYGDSYSYVGSRLGVNAEEQAKYFGTKFQATWDRYINGTQLTHL